MKNPIMALVIIAIFLLPSVNSQVTCDAYWEGYVFDKEIGECKLKGSSGCGNPFEYNTLEECKSKNTIAEPVIEEPIVPVPEPQTSESVAIVKEEVKCYFVKSKNPEKCYTEDGRFGCSGIETCTAYVSGEKGDKQIWRSSCGDHSYAIIDGNDDSIRFMCAISEPSDKPILEPVERTFSKEQVKCVFGTSKNTEKCYTDDGKFGCSGIESCVADVYGEKGHKQVWKSSCGGYVHTVIDGDDDYATFACVAAGDVEEKEIIHKGFRYSYWKCYDGTEEKQGSVSSCKSSESWQAYARKFCEGRCYEDKSKCGVSQWSVIEECYDGAASYEIISAISNQELISEASGEFSGKGMSVTISSISEPGQIVRTSEDDSNSEPLDEEILICKDSCPLDGKCYSFGYRKSEMFCSEHGSFVEQLESGSACENNFECSSNNCKGNDCRPICEGCLNENNVCIPIGTRTQEQYCDTDYSLKNHKQEDISCINNYECSTNLCVNNQCISPSFIQKIISWFDKLFG